MTESTPPASTPPPEEPTPSAVAPTAPPMTPTAPPMTPMTPPPAPVAVGRPMGATVISVIEAILAAFLLLGALALIGLGGVAGGLVGSSGDPNAVGVGAILAGAGFVFGIIFLVIGLLYVAIAYGVWKGRPWSWMLGVVVSVIGLVFAVLGLTGGITVSNIISLALPIVVLYYFMQPDVKRWLGRPA
jgi:hypothetical protein